MSMIKKIIKAIDDFNINNNNIISDYKIIEDNTNSYEEFYDLEKLETMRKASYIEDNVTIYIKKEVNEILKIASSSFIVSHQLSKKELMDKIKDAIFSASFIANDYFEIVSCDKKKSYKQKDEEKDPYVILQDIASIYFKQKSDNCSFNSLELFFTEKEVRIINSKGVDYKKKTHEVMIEAIPSYKDDNFKTELYRMFKYDNLDLLKIEEDSRCAIEDCLLRSKAIKQTKNFKTNVILKDDKVKSLFYELISTFTYASIYQGASIKKIGDMVSSNPFSLKMAPSSKANFFDNDGVLLKEIDLIKDGKLVDYYGPSRYAYYLNMQANGNLQKINLNKGKVGVSKMKKDPYIEIIDLSGIQLDIYADYIGGEVRLANYFDGKTTYPISGFSFSGSLQNAIDNIVLSSEKVDIRNYCGPKYVKLSNMEIL